MISTKSEAVRKYYLQNFWPRSFAEAAKHFPLASFHQDELHRIFLSDLMQGKKTLLEVGSGPSVNFVFSASKRFKDIVLSDLVEGSRTELKKWLSNSEDATDWTGRAQQIANLEGYSDINEGATEIMERARRAIRKVVYCDILKPGVLEDKDRELFDVVLSCNCLEAATADHESYREAVRNVGALVKTGGLLVLAGVGGTSVCHVSNQSLPMVDVTDDLIKQALADAGFQVMTYNTRAYDGPDLEARAQRFGFVVAASKD